MGLDAVVYCNCYETGKLRTAPPRPELVYVDADGGLYCRDEGDDEIYFEFERWRRDQACDHEGGVLLHHRIGNIALVALLRAELSRDAASFPLLLSRVLYNGIHGGDFMTIEKVRELEKELTPLSRLHSDDPRIEAFLRNFEAQMSELIRCSLSINKPISF